MRSGAHNAITDVDGLRVGHAEVAHGLSGTTVVLAPDGGAVAGIDARGAAPGTRETDLLRPGNVVERIHAIVLSGGSAYGLAAATGVMAALEAAGVGLPTHGGIVPIVPGAVLFDLGRGGPDGQRPGPETGAAAVAAASGGPVATGNVGAGRGAASGGLRGGVGTASAVLDDGSTVAALVIVNSAGSAVDLRTGALLAAGRGLPGEFPAAVADPAALVAALNPSRLTPGTATVLAVVATDATLDKAGCARLATMGHDGFARAIDPVHTMGDGDVIFGLSTAARQAPDFMGLVALHAAAADVVSRAVVHGVLAAESVTTPGGTWTAYRDVPTRPGV